MFVYGQVARLQEQLQTERDLRAALEIGLSMSAAQLSGAQSLDSKVWFKFLLLFLFEVKGLRAPNIFSSFE